MNSNQEHGDLLMHPPGFFTQHTDRFTVDDDEMDSDTDAESDMSLLSRSFLHRVNDQVRKIQDQSSKDATQDSNKHSLTFFPPERKKSVISNNVRTTNPLRLVTVGPTAPPRENGPMTSVAFSSIPSNATRNSVILNKFGFSPYDILAFFGPPLPSSVPMDLPQCQL